MIPRLAVIILTYNEEVHIERCIRSVRGLASAILVVDSFSTDKTVEIAEGLGAKVMQHPFKNQADQLDWALTQLEAATDWVMRLDADEQLEVGLHDAIQLQLPLATADIGGYSFCLREHFLGRPIRYGGRAIHLLRLWRHGWAKCEQRWMDEHMVLAYGSVVPLDGYLLHSNEKPLTEWIAKHNGYSNREAIDVLNRKYRFFESTSAKVPEGASALLRSLYYTINGPLAPILYFLYRYVLRLGFLDGREGYLYHFLQGYWYRTLVVTKLIEFERLISGCATNEQRLTMLQQHTRLKW